MGKYQTYLNSDQWRSTRNFTIDRVRTHAKQPVYQCEKCKEFFRTDAIEVHHKHYRSVGRESQQDLMVLCRWCHGETHGKSKDKLLKVGNKAFYLDCIKSDLKTMSDGENEYRRGQVLRSLASIEMKDNKDARRGNRLRCRAIGREAKVRDGIGDG